MSQHYIRQEKKNTPALTQTFGQFRITLHAHFWSVTRKEETAKEKEEQAYIIWSKSGQSLNPI